VGKFEVKQLDMNLEKQILTRMITSTQFLRDINDFIQEEYFTTKYIQTVATWILEYFEEFEMSPNGAIKDIFEQKSILMEDSEAEMLRMLLSNMSDIDDAEEKSDDHEYITSRTLEYCKKRELELTAGNIKYYLEQNDVVNAEKELLQFRTVTATVSECVDVFDEEVVRRAFQEQKEGLLQLTGALGDFLGAFHRSWLVVFSGAYKRGKTWWLLDVYINAALSDLNVIMFSLEMTQDNLMERILHRVTGCADEASTQRIPVVDCLLNQKGECTRPEYCGTFVPLFVEGEELLDEAVDGYVVCTACRDTENAEFFQPTVWYENHDYQAMTERMAVDKANALSQQYANRCKLKTYPRFSANIADIKRDLSVLETTQNFIPDVIIIDYADILKPESNNSNGIQKEDETWIALSQLAGERKALVLTATQLTKDGQDAKTVSVAHTARWSGKLGHVDAILGINQTPKEKDKGVQRINTILHRHQPFSESEQCMVLQNLDIGAVHLDSFQYRPSEENNE